MPLFREIIHLIFLSSGEAALRFVFSLQKKKTPRLEQPGSGHDCL